MLFGTFQPLFRADCNPTFKELKDSALRATGTDVKPQDYKGTEPEPLETLLGYRPVWCFPARDFHEAFVHALLTAPNAPDLFFLVESDDYVRVDKVKHYAAIGRDADAVEGVRASIDPGCPDARSEFLLPVESLETARLMAFTASGADPVGGSTILPACIAGHDGKCQIVGIPPECYAGASAQLARMQTLLEHARPDISAMAEIVADEQEAQEKIASEAIRLGFMFFVMPLLYEFLERDANTANPGTMLLLQYTGTYLLDCCNRMARWSYGECGSESYMEIFQDAWDHVVTDEALATYVSDHGYRLPGRNETCPCGSGKKFKKCHGRILA